MVLDIPGARGHGVAQHVAIDECGGAATDEACGRSCGDCGGEVSREANRYTTDAGFEVMSDRMRSASELVTGL
jgi:hypothetical protein